MSQNLVIPNKDNKVVFVFGGIDLTQATNIEVQFGAETYSTISTPLQVQVLSATELSLDLSATAEVGKIFATITYFDSSSVNGTDITSRELNNSDKIVVAIGTQLIIEDGTIVAGANSFVTDDEFKQYANIRNFDVPATQPDREALLILAMDYLFNKEYKLQGCRVSEEQELPYPRYGVCANGFYVDSGTIPKGIKSAQMELALQSASSDLLISTQVSNVESEKVGELEISYFSGGSWTEVRTDRADSYLRPYMKNHGSNNQLMRF